jgi:hypothetical protein
VAKRKPSKHSWFKFWHKEWLVDPELRICSPAARGVWIDLICVMANSSEPGILLVAGRPASEEDISKLTGIPDKRVIKRLLAELEANGVASRDSRGAVLSRKMCRMHVEWLQSSADGRGGGNPLLNIYRDLTAVGVNPPLNHPLKAEEEEEEEDKKDSVLELRSNTGASAPSMDLVGQKISDTKTPARPPRQWPPPMEPPMSDDAKAVLFGWGLDVLEYATGKPPDKLRPWLGKMRQHTGEDDVLLVRLIAEMCENKPAEAVSWLSGAVKDRMEKRKAETARITATAVESVRAGRAARSPEEEMVRRVLAGEVDEDGEEIHRAAPHRANDDFLGATLEGEIA